MNSSTIDAILNTLSGLMLALTFLAICYPWRPKQRFASKLIHAPLAFIPVWITYEVMMPENMNIRADLFIIAPLAVLAIAIWVAKVAHFRRIKQKEAEQVGAGDAEEAV